MQGRCGGGIPWLPGKRHLGFFYGHWELGYIHLLALRGWIQIQKPACQSDIVNFTGTIDPGLGQTFPSPDYIKGALDSLNIEFGRPSPESDVMIDSLLVFGDVGPGSGRIWPGCSLSRRLLAKDVLQSPVGPMNLGVVLIMRVKELGVPVINRCISRQFTWNAGMKVMTLLDRASGISFQLCLPVILFSDCLGKVLESPSHYPTPAAPVELSTVSSVLISPNRVREDCSSGSLDAYPTGAESLPPMLMDGALSYNFSLVDHGSDVSLLAFPIYPLPTGIVLMPMIATQTSLQLRRILRRNGNTGAKLFLPLVTCPGRARLTPTVPRWILGITLWCPTACRVAPIV